VSLELLAVLFERVAEAFVREELDPALARRRMATP
jgi:hypothetical protein